MSLVAFKARNHPQQSVRDAVDDRRTPDEVYAPLHARHRFTLDAAASAANRKCERYYDRDTDGLLRAWSGERVWCNPPFSRLEPWVAKAWGEMRDACNLVVMLLPANRCEQRFWQTWIEPYRDADPIDGIRLRSRFLSGRPRFTPPGATIPKKGDRPPFGCVILTWEHPERALAIAVDPVSEANGFSVHPKCTYTDLRRTPPEDTTRDED